MNRIKSISIPEPCAQSWQQMAPVNGGRHCESCCKTVVDFTTMSDSEIIGYLSKANNTCGRFSNDQLSHINGQLEIESSKNEKFWTKWLIAASVLGLAFFGRANGQTVTRQTTEQRDTGKVNPQNFPLGKIAVLPTRRKISGYVTDETNERLPGVSITVPGTTIVAQTDITGAFSLETPLSCRQLKIYFIGFATKVIDLSDYAAPGNYQIKLHQNYLTGDVVIIRRPFFKRVYYNFIRNPFRKIFK